MARMEKLAQKLEPTANPRAEKTKEVERELGLPTPGVQLLKDVFKRLKGEMEQPVEELPPGGVIPPTPVTGGGGG
jgi:hypothetical protein